MLAGPRDGLKPIMGSEKQEPLGPWVLKEPLGMSRILSPDRTSRNLQMVLYRVTLGSVLSRKPLPVAPQQTGVAELEKWYQVRRKYRGCVTYRFKLWSNRAVLWSLNRPHPHPRTLSHSVCRMLLRIRWCREVAIFKAERQDLRYTITVRNQLLTLINNSSATH